MLGGRFKFCQSDFVDRLCKFHNIYWVKKQDYQGKKAQ